MSELLANPLNQTCTFARALYDNIAEAPDELAFRKGDVLSVLEQNTAGLEGWWMCSLRGRQGICPGNRLKLVDIKDIENGMQQLGSNRTSRNSALLQIKYDVPQNCNSDYATLSRSSANAERIGSYDVPPRAMSVLASSAGSSSPASSCYEVPRPQPSNDSSTLTLPRFDSPLDYYNEPRPASTQSRRPRSSISSLGNENSLCGSNRSTYIGADYDVPRSNAPRNLPAQVRHYLSTPKTTPPPTNVYDIPVSKETCESELEALQKLQAECLSAVNRLLEFVNPSWNTSDQNSMDLRLAILKIRTSMHDLVEFAEGTFANAEKAPDKCTITRLHSLVNSLRETDKLVQQTASKLSTSEWDDHKLKSKKNDHNSGSDSMNPLDRIDQIVSSLSTLSEDVRQLTNFIQINATLLFDHQTNSSSSCNNHNNNNRMNESHNDTKNNNNFDSNHESFDNGYVNLNLSSKVKPRVEVWDSCYDSNKSELETIQQLPPMEVKDKQLLTFYTAQIIIHTVHLTNAIDTFLQTVERNQPPKLFLVSAKFVLLRAHRMVHIYDTLCGNQVCRYVKPKLLQCCNALYATLAETVSTTKQAALFFPSVSAVQAMVDSVVDISNFATDIKMTMIHIIQQLKNHPYEVCEVISLPIQNGNVPYLQWIDDVVPSAESRRKDEKKSEA